ncbi:MAG: TonB-dependent receptor plug domain-containing protein [Bacteroidia bacterium]
MRFTVLLLIFVAGIGRAQTVLDTPLNDWKCSESLISCLSQMEDSFDLRFAYKQDDLYTISGDVNGSYSTVGSYLTLICNANDLSFSVIQDYVLIKKNTASPSYVIVGLVKDASNGELVSEVEVRYSGQVIYTDDFGLFRIKSNQDSINLLLIKEGYQYLYASIPVNEDVFASFNMSPIASFEPIRIVRSQDSAIRISSHSFDEIDPSQQRIASFGGEIDALSNLRLKGGLQNVGLGDPGLLVRGGGPDQNFVLIDGIPVYNTLHILGLYSIFNSSTINSIKLYKDAFPSRYGSRLSSVLDVNLFNGNKERLSGDADIGLISSGFSINGPLVKEKLSFSLAARRTYADIFTKPIQGVLNRNEAQENNTALWYYDVFAKLHYQPNKKHQFKLSLYNGGDELNFSSALKLRDALQTTETTSADLKWRNSLAGLQWHAVLNSSLFMKVQTAYSGFQMDFSDSYRYDQIGASQTNQTSYSTGLEEWRNNIDFDLYTGKNNHILFGGGYVAYGFKPFSQRYLYESELSVTDTTFNISRINSNEVYAYLEDNIYTPNGLISAGLRLAKFSADGENYYSIQPRLYITRNLSKNSQLRFSLTDMAQFLHLLPNNNLGLPVDIWLPIVKGTEPLRSFQMSTSLKLKYKKWRGSIGFFAKNYRNLIEHKSGSNFLLSNEDWRKSIETGSGSSAGVELEGGLYVGGWTIDGAYTFSRSRRTFSGINNGNTFFSKFDRPHNLNLLASFQFNPLTRMSISFSYASGNPVTIPSSRYVTRIGGKEILVEVVDEINNYQLPATHHLDIAFHRIRNYEKLKTEFTFGIYNLYNQLNPFMVYIGLDENVEPVFKLRSYLPMMPMLKYHIKF